MDRRSFLGCLGAVTAVPLVHGKEGVHGQESDLVPGASGCFLNAAAGTPLATFSEEGLQAGLDAWRGGHDSWKGVLGRVEDARSRFARLIGADSEEIAFVHCTKAGEALVLEGLPALAEGANVVTNDLHFGGSLHHLLGLQREGLDLRIVRARDWSVSLEDMAEAIDERTALVAVTLVSNINGHVEPLAELARIAHERGALVYADIIQAAGIVPIDVRALGADFAACSGYKWLFGPHGAGFLYVGREHQGTALRDSLFPGQARAGYEPWISPALEEDYSYRAPVDARRYQPGHVSYLGYCALASALEAIEGYGVERLLAHSVKLNRRLAEGIDPDRYRSISPHPDRSPIAAYELIDSSVDARERLERRLVEAQVRISLGPRRMRISPAIYNDEGDIDRLLEVLA